MKAAASPPNPNVNPELLSMARDFLTLVESGRITSGGVFGCCSESGETVDRMNFTSDAALLMATQNRARQEHLDHAMFTVFKEHTKTITLPLDRSGLSVVSGQ